MNTQKTTYWLVGIIMALLAVALFVHLDGIGLRAEEPRRAIVGIETLLSGNMVVPQIHEWTYYNKPPFFNWVLASTFAVTGSFEEWAVRLPGVLSMLVIAAGVYWITRKYLNKQTALYSSLFFLTCSELLFYASVNAGEIDLFYALVIFLQVIPFLVFRNRKHLLWMFLLSYLFAGIGTLTKGLPSIAFQGITVIAILVAEKKWKWLFAWQHFVGIALFTAMVGGYFYLYSMQDDLQGFLANLYKESSQRSANEHGIATILPHIFLFPLEIVRLMLPWTLLVFFMFRKGVRKQIQSNDLLRFSAVFVLANIILYWISPDIRGRYLYMFFPFILIIITHFFLQNRDQMPKFRIAIEVLFGVLIAAMAGFFIAFPWIDQINQEVSQPAVIAVVFGLVMIVIMVLFVKWKAQRVLLVVLALIVGRIGHNVALLPHLHANARCSTYMANVDDILEIADGEKVLLTGRSIKWIPDVNLLGMKLGEEELVIPPPLPYQIPYYFFKESGQLLSYTPTTVPGSYYMAHTQYVQHIEKEILYTFQDEWTSREMILFIAQ